MGGYRGDAFLAGKRGAVAATASLTVERGRLSSNADHVDEHGGQQAGNVHAARPPPARPTGVRFAATITGCRSPERPP